MSPVTHKLLKQIVRLLKGILTAFDKWVDQSSEVKEED